MLDSHVLPLYTNEGETFRGRVTVGSVRVRLCVCVCICLCVCMSVSKVFEGNVDAYSVKHSYLDQPIIARFVKFHTIHWHQHPSMRVELVGCQGNVSRD